MNYPALNKLLKNKLFWFCILIIIIEGLIVGFVYNVLKNQENNDINNFIMDQSNKIISEYDIIISGTEHLISRNDKIFQVNGKKVKLHDFELYVDFDTLPSSVNIRYQRWFPRITYDERSDFEAFGHMYIRENYTILDYTQIFPFLVFEIAANRSEYFPFALSVPDVPFSLGGDIMTVTPELTFDIELAISSNKSTAVRRTRLFELNSKVNHAIRVVSPVYLLNSTDFKRDELIGITETLYIPNNILSLIMDENMGRGNVDIFMYDLSDTIHANESLIYRENKEEYSSYNTRDSINDINNIDYSFNTVVNYINRDYYIQFIFEESYLDNERTFFPEGILITLIVVFLSIDIISYVVYKSYRLNIKSNLTNMQYNILTNVNHNMRNPLNIIKGSIEVVIFNLSTQLGINEQFEVNKKVFKNLTDFDMTINSIELYENVIFPLIHSYHQTINLTNIIYGSDYVNDAILGEGRTTPTINMISDIIESMNDIIMIDIDENHNIDYQIQIFDKKYELFVDSKKLSQILIIFLRNAFQYTQTGKIILNVIKQSESIIKFNIIDTGIGISPDIAKTLFETKDAKPSITGSGGLGTYHAKLIANSIKADIGYKKMENGSNFWVNVPIIQPPLNNESTNA
jgi:hypothetical protein